MPALCPPPLLRPCSLPRVPWPAPCARSWELPLSPPAPRSALPWLARSSACAPSPSSWITRRASRCLCSCGSVTPGGERSGAGGRTCRARAGGKGLGGNCLGVLVWVWVGLAWARYFALSLPTAAAAAAAGEAPVARAGSFPLLRGVLGVAAWPAEAAARLAGAVVATPRAPSSLSSAAVAAAGEAPVARAGSVPRFHGLLGVAAWPAEAVARPAGAAVATPRASSSLPSAAVAAAGEAPVARAGSVFRFCGVLGVAAWPAEAVARPAGGAVATPRAPSSLSSAAAAAIGDAPGSCAGATPHVGGVLGAAVGAAAWTAGAAVSASCASGAPSRGGAAGLAAWAAGAVTSAGSGSRAGGGGPTSTAASASLRSSRSARVSPVHSGEAGKRERDPRWWRSSRWGEPSESAITVILVSMRGGRRALPTTSWCISAVPWAVPSGALRGGGGEGVGGRLWCQPRTAGGRRPSIGIGRGGGGATRPTRRATAPSLGRGPGPWAPGGRRVASGGAALGGTP